VMQRRNFIKACAATCAVGAHEMLAAQDISPRFYSRALLVNELGRPVTAASLIAGRNYLFHYPFESTPCFLINLGKSTAREVRLKMENGSTYLWAGGVGRQKAVVGYSAICAHRMSYPTPQISFISYREQSTAAGAARPNTIHCCSEHSEYDPAAGARVLGGPAPQPLAAILLEHDGTTDALHATGTLGGEMFNAFFAKYDFKLAIDYGSDHARQPVADRTVVRELQQFCRQQVRC